MELLPRRLEPGLVGVLLHFGNPMQELLAELAQFLHVGFQCRDFGVIFFPFLPPIHSSEPYFSLDIMRSDYPSQQPFATPQFTGPQDFSSQNFGAQAPGGSGSSPARSIVRLILAIVLAAWLLGAGIVVATLSLMKSTEPYQHGLQVALNDARVQAKLGAPVRAGWLARGRVNTSGASGYARIWIPLKGSAHKGTLYLVARKLDGQWRYQTLGLSVEGGNDSMDILAGSALPSSPGTQQSGQQAPSRSGKVRVRSVPAFVGLLVLAIGIYIFGIANLVFRVIKLSVPYRHAVQVATNDARVQAILGAPVKPGWTVGGTVSARRASGGARLSIPLQGTAQKGRLCVVATKLAGDWSYQKLELNVASGESVDLSTASGL